MATIKNFEELNVWKEAISLCKELYFLTQNSVCKKDYSITDQMRRSVVSISNNIAEEFEYNNNNYFIKYLQDKKANTLTIKHSNS